MNLRVSAEMLSLKVKVATYPLTEQGTVQVGVPEKPKPEVYYVGKVTSNLPPASTSVSRVKLKV